MNNQKIKKSYKEVWRKVDGSNCWVSNFGRIRNPDKFKILSTGDFSLKLGYIKKTCLDRDGYARVSLIINGTKTCCLVHRIVAKAFIDNPNDFLEVNHIDLDKQNNYFKNLEWCSNWQNVKHAICNGSHGAKLNDKIAKETRDAYAAGGVSMNTIAKRLNVSITTIAKIIHNKTWVQK